MTMIYPAKEWEREYARAEAFFKCKGIASTKARLKQKWKKEFLDYLYKVGEI